MPTLSLYIFTFVWLNPSFGHTEPLSCRILKTCMVLRYSFYDVKSNSFLQFITNHFLVAKQLVNMLNNNDFGDIDIFASAGVWRMTKLTSNKNWKSNRSWTFDSPGQRWITSIKGIKKSCWSCWLGQRIVWVEHTYHHQTHLVKRLEERIKRVIGINQKKTVNISYNQKN